MPLYLAMNMTASADPNFTSSLAASILWQSCAPSILPRMTSVKKSMMRRPLSVFSRTISAMVGGFAAPLFLLFRSVGRLYRTYVLLWGRDGGLSRGSFSPQRTQRAQRGELWGSEGIV